LLRENIGNANEDIFGDSIMEGFHGIWDRSIVKGLIKIFKEFDEHFYYNSTKGHTDLFCYFIYKRIYIYIGWIQNNLFII